MFRAFRADHVLNRAADAARDIQFGLNAIARLTDLVGVRTPAHAGSDARTADRAAEQSREFFQLFEPFRAADAASAADDYARFAERDFVRCRFDARADARAQISLRQLRRERIYRNRLGGRGCVRGKGGWRDGQQFRRASSFASSYKLPAKRNRVTVYARPPARRYSSPPSANSFLPQRAP